MRGETAVNTRAKSDLAKKVVAKVAKDQKTRRRKSGGMSTEMMQTLGAVAFMVVCLAIVGATMFRSDSDKPVRTAQRDTAKTVTVAAADDIDERDTVRPRAKTEGLAAFVQSGLEEERKAERQRRGETEVAAAPQSAPAADDDDDVPVVRQRGTPMVFDVPRKLERAPAPETVQPKPAATERAKAEPPAPAPAAKPVAKPVTVAAERAPPFAATKPTLPAAPVEDEAPAPVAVEPQRSKPAVAEVQPVVADSKTTASESRPTLPESKPTVAPVQEVAAARPAKEPVKAPAAVPAPVVATVEPVREPQGFGPAPSPRLAEPRIELPDEPKPEVAEVPVTPKTAVAPVPAAATVTPSTDMAAVAPSPAVAAPVKAAPPSPAVVAVTPAPVENVAAKATAAPVMASVAPVAPAPVAAARVEPAAQAAEKPAAVPAPATHVETAPSIAKKPVDVPAVPAKPVEAAPMIANVMPAPAVPAVVAAKPVEAVAAPAAAVKPAEAQTVPAKPAPVVAAQPAPVATIAAKPVEPATPVAKMAPPAPVVVATVPPAAVAPAVPAAAPAAGMPEAPKSRWEEWSRDILAIFAPAKPAFKGAGDLKDCADCPDLMVVPTGFFTMGADAADRDARPPERPAVRARITKSFAMGRTEVTVGEYRAFLAATKRAAPDCASFATAVPTAPVSCVSHADALAYVDWLSGQTGERYRLPSAAEWEYAAKAGRESTSIPVRVAALKSTASDASAEPNPFGFVGMGGSVAELVADCFTKSLAEAPTDGTAAVAEGGCRNRVVKDGSDAEPAPYHRPSSRRAVAFDQRFEGIGFRVAREISTKKR